MDNRIFIAKLSWLPSEQDGRYDTIPGPEIKFPLFRRFLKEIPFRTALNSHWTVFIQNIKFLGPYETLAYFRYAAWNVVPTGTQIGQTFTIWRGPSKVSSKGIIVGIVDDETLRAELLGWETRKEGSK